MGLEKSFSFEAGRLVFDFINTVYERPGYNTSKPAVPIELLESSKDLINWCAASPDIPPDLVAKLKAQAKGKQATLESALKNMVELREALFGDFFELIVKGAISEVRLRTLNIKLSKQPAKILKKSRSDLTLTWPESLEAVDELHATIVNDAIEAITTEDLTRLRFCGAKNCGWLFIDRSKSNRRRWCDMADCGNREKQRRFQQDKLSTKLAF